MYKQKIPFTIIFLLVMFDSIAQVKPSLKQFDLEINKKEKKIIIPYKLSDGSDYRYDYDIKIFISNDSGNTYNGPLKELKGYHGKNIIALDSLGNYEAWWMYEEEPDFDGKNMKIKLKVDYKPSVFNFMDEPAMLYSVLLPGLGQHKVRALSGWKKRRWIATPLLVYGAIAGSIWMNYESGYYYCKYNHALRRLEAQDFYNKSNQRKHISTGLAIFAGAIWAADIVLVGLRGRNNRLTKKKILQNHEDIRKELSLTVDPTSAHYGFAPTPMLTFKVKF